MAPRRSRRDTKQRLKSSITALAAVCLVIFVGGALVQIDSVSPGRIDIHATKQIRKLCVANTSCTVRLGDLVPATWDTFYEFSPSVSRSEIDTVLRTGQIRTAPHQRVVVLLRRGQVVLRQYAHTGHSQPLAGSIIFAETNPLAHTAWVVYTPEIQFQVTSCPTREGGSAFGHHGGTYYLLTPRSLQPETQIRCQITSAA